MCKFECTHILICEYKCIAFVLLVIYAHIKICVHRFCFELTSVVLTIQHFSLFHLFSKGVGSIKVIACGGGGGGADRDSCVVTEGRRDHAFGGYAAVPCA